MHPTETSSKPSHELRVYLTELRRRLHQIPESGLNCPETQQAILAEIQALPLTWTLGDSLSSVTAVLKGGSADRTKEVPAILLRADMDALPVQELSGLPYASKRRGFMHACGHDLHTAMLIGAARILSARRDALVGDVVFMFQPGEEGYHGARMMIDEGVLDASGARVRGAYALHVFTNGFETGQFSSRPGVFLSASDELRVRVIGEGGHGAAPHRALDPVPAAATMLTALHSLVTRRFDIFDPVIVAAGRISAGSKSNVVPSTAEFDLSLRSFSTPTRDRLTASVLRLLRGIAVGFDVEIEIEQRHGYPPTKNNKWEEAFVAATVTDLFGSSAYAQAEHSLPGSEDFAYVLQEVPGCFIAVGAGEGADPRADNHSPQAVFDDSALDRGAQLMAALAQRRLASLAEHSA